jgi:hypothetical protein
MGYYSISRSRENPRCIRQGKISDIMSPSAGEGQDKHPAPPRQAHQDSLKSRPPLVAQLNCFCNDRNRRQRDHRRCKRGDTLLETLSVFIRKPEVNN